MPPENQRELVLADNEQAFVQDTTKGPVQVYVGPLKVSLSETDKPVRRRTDGQFEPCNLQDSKMLFITVNEGSYVVLENPSDRPPDKGGSSAIPLQFGRKVTIPGPTRFPLWPGQTAEVIQGHNLKTNQFLIARVYNAEAAETNWDKSVLQTKEASADGKQPLVLEKPENLTIGKLFVVPGTHVSFYIPPTGIEIVKTPEGKFVRDAVTLERLEYCVLLDESGEKRYVSGPKMVFPKPTEAFVEEGGTKVFKAIELNHLMGLYVMGLYVKVIADYEEDGPDGQKIQHKVGDELFIRGEAPGKTTLYFPRPEHAIIKYGDQKTHYAITIPAGEARYVLDRNTGEIKTVHGPKMLLPDPRTEVIIRRRLDRPTIELLYPGNQEALAYNKRLEAMAQEVSAPGEMFVTQNAYRAMTAQPAATYALMADVQVGAGGMPEVQRKAASSRFVGDDFDRQQKYTPPRTLQLDTKYDGAVSVTIWNGFAVMVVDKKGNRRVEVGPKTILLEYDEMLEPLELSTGKPKTTDTLLRTVYLQVLNNLVSDIVMDAETSDLCRVSIKLSYRVNFEGDDPKKWFDVGNYVKFLCDHMRSRLKNEIRKHGVREFHQNAIDIVRDCVLGKPVEGAKRPGQLFAENAMRIYDVEVLNVTIGDQTIAQLLVGNEHETVKQHLKVEGLKRQLELAEQEKKLQGELAELDAKLKLRQIELEKQKIAEENALEAAKMENEMGLALARKQKELELEGEKSKIAAAELERDKAMEEFKQNIADAILANDLKKIEAETAAAKEKFGAFSPSIVQALTVFADKHLAAQAATAMAPLAMLEKTSVREILARLLDGGALGTALIAQGIARQTQG